MSIDEIRPISFGKANGYVLKIDGKIIIADTGIKGKFKVIERTLAEMGFDR